MKNCGTHYEYICIYVDNVAHAMQNLQEVIDALVNDGGYKLNSVGPKENHLSADIYRNSVVGTLCFEKSTTFHICFLLPAKQSSGSTKGIFFPFDHCNDHPELDTSDEFLPESNIKDFQLLADWHAPVGGPSVFVALIFNVLS